MLTAHRLLLAVLLGALLPDPIQPNALTAGPLARLMAWSETISGDDPAGDPPPQPSPQHASQHVLPQATLKPVAATSPDIPVHDYDFQSEQELLQLANQSRAQAGAPPLTLDSGLSQAARIHAQAMVDARQLSHQFAGEPSLSQRLAATTELQLDQEGENVGYDFDAEHGHQHFMLSPPHRANLLNPAYNVVGLGVVRGRDDGRIYMVQDFGHALPNYSSDEMKDRIAAAVSQMRQQAHQPALPRRDLSTADDAACSMADADKLGTSSVHQLAQRYTVLSFTALHPEILPGGAEQAINAPTMRSFSLGACYGKTATYPTGVYWVVLSLE